MNELDLVAKIRRLAALGLPKSPQITLGIGDDCAIYRPRRGEELLFTSDQTIEGVHFRRTLPAKVVGQRALARNLSDIAAMGGEPRFCLVSLAVPPKTDDAWILDFYRGLLQLARRTGTALAGGDLSHAKHIYCDITVCGGVPRGKALLRSGARAGDRLYVSGRLGKAWDRPIQPRLALGKSLRGLATSCMDISDGLSLDLYRLCLESGVAAEVDRVPLAPGATLARALHGGDDYELLFTLPPRRSAPRRTTFIGTIVKGRPGAVSFQGNPLPPRGYDHFL